VLAVPGSNRPMNRTLFKAMSKRVGTQVKVHGYDYILTQVWEGSDVVEVRDDYGTQWVPYQHLRLDK
jgi:hypothetical protein